MILRLLQAILLVMCMFSLTVKAKSEIHFTEHRILLTEKVNSQKYTITNRGDTPAECTVTLVDYAVAKDGKLSKIKDNLPIPTSAVSILRVSPKKTVVAPNAVQKLKVIARGLRKKPTGEWVSYLSLSCKDTIFEGDGMVNVQPVFVFQIPVIVRKGTLQGSLNITDARINTNKVTFTLNYTGNRSLYGDITVYDEKSNKLGLIRGISVYQQVAQMPMEINLSKPATGNKITIKFVERKKFGSTSESLTLML